LADARIRKKMGGLSSNQTVTGTLWTTKLGKDGNKQKGILGERKGTKVKGGMKL